MALGHSLPYGREIGVGTPSMAFDEHVVRSRKFTFYAKLTGDVVSHVGLHVGLTIFRCINML